MKKPRNKRHRELELVRRDGALCVTFVNTSAGQAGPGRQAIVTYAELLAWAKLAGALGAAAAKHLELVAAERPTGAGRALHRAQQWRDRLERIVVALAARGVPAPADVDALNAELALSAYRLVPAVGGYAWTWDGPGDDELDRMLWPVILSAADVLASKARGRVRRCAGQDCELLFVDRSSGSPRKWCSRKRCGDRARAKRRYHASIKPLLQESRRRRHERPPATGA